MSNAKPIMDLKEFIQYTGFGETYARILLKSPRNGFAAKIGGKWFVHKERFDQWLLNKCDEF